MTPANPATPMIGSLSLKLLAAPVNTGPGGITVLPVPAATAVVKKPPETAGGGGGAATGGGGAV
jgi:hypothetical protein